MKDIAIGFFSFVLSILLQILIFNQISLLGYGCIFFHLIFVLISPLRFKTIPLMLMAFAMGLTVDVFSNSYGIHAFSLTLVSAIRGGIINLFFSKEDTEHHPNLFVGLSADILFVCLCIRGVRCEIRIEHTAKNSCKHHCYNDIRTFRTICGFQEIQ